MLLVLYLVHYNTQKLNDENYHYNSFFKETGVILGFVFVFESVENWSNSLHLVKRLKCLLNWEKKLIF